MLDFTWKVFCMTGNIDSYLLMKEIEMDQDKQLPKELEQEEPSIREQTS
ncbi:YqzL family protein [Sporolactobacillus spathodeae]|uniref:YqzL family protein n=1 Tax=Sporolactobacillus spathodeae TaxID=1465502 RepID=A0ABS2Q6C1_9BACL|nr:YqzL family protein [Sporolactobacillus spathodeae]MBM7657334.1 hypothetical protein [Sporolactobacillus spathodeae]